MAVKLGNGNWAVKEDKLLAYNDNSGRFFNKEFDFSRGSIATYVGKDGLIKSAASDVPRIDFSDSTNGALLLEGQSTNLFTQSETFSNWQTENGKQVVTTGVVISPDGTQNGNKLVTYNGGETQRKLWVQKTVTPGESYNFSVYIKKVSGQLNTGFLHITTGPNDSYDATQEYTATDQWQRISVTTSSALSTPIRFLITGDSDSQIYIWGAQAEALSYATSYIPTNGSTVTRLADVCNNSGSAQDFNSEEGVLYAEIAALADDLTNRFISLTDGTDSNSVTIFYGGVSNRIRTEIKSGAVTQANLLTTSYPITNFNKIAVKYKGNDFALWVNGVEVATDTSGSTPIGLNDLSFNRANILDFYGKTKNVKAFKRALTDEELAALTTI